jgi:hypothetical protein
MKTLRVKERLAEAIEEVSRMEPSSPDSFEQLPVYTHYSSSAQKSTQEVAFNTSTPVQVNCSLVLITLVRLLSRNHDTKDM